ncbi:MAG: hypothetical protein M1813_008545 [Trichoglossum hirsutum]|nr:MAG: hypothetical protein M1813_008545 [Trichoglossum hirsutum]
MSCDELDRFRIWAGNIGALQHVKVRSSLDYRLRDAPKLGDQISRLLVDLNTALADVCSIASGRKPNRTSSALDDEELLGSSKDDGEPGGPEGDSLNVPTVSEIQERFQSASNTISHLFRLSVIIRNATPRDRYSKAAAAANEPFDDRYDIAHVGHKFPRLGIKENEWLKIRLGKAITQRRQYLRYCREHQEKLSKTPGPISASESRTELERHIQDSDPGQEPNPKIESRIADAIAPSSHVQTTASTLMPSDIKEDCQSQFSYATSVDESSSPDSLQIVPLARVIGDLVRKHVLSDIRPYVCTFRDCDLKLFADRHVWFEHELQNHRLKWHCYLCPHTQNGHDFEYQSADDFKCHIRLRHAQQIPEALLLAFTQAGQHSTNRIPATSCPLCDEWEKTLKENNPGTGRTDALVTTPEQFRKHLGDHMVQLALFSLPRVYGEEEDAASNAAKPDAEIEEYPQSNVTPSCSSANSLTTASSLKRQLYNARRESPLDSPRFFVPKSAQESLITRPVIKSIIQEEQQEIEEEEADRYARETCQSARQLFAILAFIGKGSEICPLLNEAVSDKDLPLVDDTSTPELYTLQRKTGIHIKTLEKWKERDLSNFYRIQWCMVAPVFEYHNHYELEDNTILPFISFEFNGKPWYGGYSEVCPRRLHPAHHSFWEHSKLENDEPLVAVKQLYSPDETEFQTEATFIKALSSKKHPHLIDLLVTFKYHQNYHLVFPFADSDLRKFWKDRLLPNFDEPTVIWSLKQMTGIADALWLIHNYIPTPPSSGTHPDLLRLLEDAKLSVGGEELFGYHGNIKPESILWFRRTVDEMGILKVASFGEARLHGQSGIDSNTTNFFRTYESPEGRLYKPVSCSSDIWSLGCSFLEFITWLLKGSDEIIRFADFRGSLPSIGIIDDDFFTISDGSEAIVRKEVIDWVDQLHEHRKCSKLVHDLLDLTIQRLLVVDPKERASARELSQQLEEYSRRAENDKQYLLIPMPSPPKPPPLLEGLFPIKTGTVEPGVKP